MASKIRTLPYRLCGLDYVYITVPIALADDGSEYIDLPVNMIERAIASKVVAARIPIRGAEVKFLRAALGYTLKDWGAIFGLSAAGVNKWERARIQRLLPVNEAAVRSFCAEDLNIEIDGRWSELVSDDKVPKRLSLRIVDAA